MIMYRTAPPLLPAAMHSTYRPCAADAPWGEKLVLCDCLGMDYDGEIERIEPGGTSVLVRILGCCQSVSEPSLRVTLFQARRS